MILSITVKGNQMNNHIAEYWDTYVEGKESKDTIKHKLVRCLLCPNHCIIPEGKSGKCTVRKNINGQLFASSYGFITSIALDPIEKKPLYEFHGGSKILSIGSYGCNFHCPFCQNHTISLDYADRANINITKTTPREILEAAERSIPYGNIGAAYTYNEPLIWYEFIKDCSQLIKKAGLVNVLVTNGYICTEPLIKLLPYIDALNIDIKANSISTYNMVGGTLIDIQKTVEIAKKSCHIEITTLILPEIDDNDIEQIARMLASIDKNIPYHLTRFFPRYKYKNKEATPPSKMYRLKAVADQYLDKVYIGNM